MEDSPSKSVGFGGKTFIWVNDPVRETPNNPLPKATESDVLSYCAQALKAESDSASLPQCSFLKPNKKRERPAFPKDVQKTKATLIRSCSPPKKNNPSNMMQNTPMDYQALDLQSSHLILNIWGTPHSVLPNTKRPRMKGAFRDVVRHGDHGALRQVAQSQKAAIF